MPAFLLQFRFQRICTVQSCSGLQKGSRLYRTEPGESGSREFPPKAPTKISGSVLFSRHHSSGKCRQHVDRLDSNGDLPLIQIQFPQCQRQQRKKDSCHNPGQKHPFSCSKYSVFPCSCCFHIQSLPYITICASFENMNRTGLTFHPS